MDRGVPLCSCLRVISLLKNPGTVPGVERGFLLEVKEIKGDIRVPM